MSKPEKALCSLIDVFNIYKTNYLGVTISKDDCKFFAEELKKLIDIYNIKIKDDDEKYTK